MSDLSDRDLANHIRDLRVQIAALEGHLEPAAARSHRNVKLVRGTFLTVGGFLTATLNPLGIALVLVGGWDWIDALADDAAAANRRIALGRAISRLTQQLDEAEAEFRKRQAVER